jgi:hypothetical protein
LTKPVIETVNGLTWMPRILRAILFGSVFPKRALPNLNDWQKIIR